MRRAFVFLAAVLALAAPARADLEFVTIPGGDVVATELTPDGAEAATHRPAQDEEEQATFRLPAAPGQVVRLVLKRPNFDDLPVAFVAKPGNGRWAWAVASGGAWPSADRITGNAEDRSGWADAPLYFAKTLRFRTSPEATAFFTRVKQKQDVTLQVGSEEIPVAPLETAGDGKVVVPRAYRPDRLYAVRSLFETTPLRVEGGDLDVPGDAWPPEGQAAVPMKALYGPFSYGWFQVAFGVAAVGGAAFVIFFVLPKRRAQRKDEVRRLTVADTIASQTETHLAAKGTLPPLLGQTFRTERGEEFILLKLLGEGGMGAVFEATSLARPEEERWAVKVLFTDIWEDPAYRKRFMREAQVCATLTHPGIVKVLDWGVHHPPDAPPDGPGLGFMVMEKVDGEEMTAWIEDGRSQQAPVSQVLGWTEDVLKALSNAHASDIIHRDLKPANLMISRKTGRVKVMDFGLARQLDRNSLTQTGTAMGTPMYMSPEHVDAKRACAASDLYSLGVLTYEALTGRLPYENADDIASLFAAILYGEPVPIQQVRPDLPDDVAQVVMRMINGDLEMRYATAQEVLADLERLSFRVGSGS